MRGGKLSVHVYVCVCVCTHARVCMYVCACVQSDEDDTLDIPCTGKEIDVLMCVGVSLLQESQRNPNRMYL